MILALGEELEGSTGSLKVGKHFLLLASLLMHGGISGKLAPIFMPF